MTPVGFDELDGGEQLRLTWGLYWRGALMAIGAMLVSMLAGGLAGFVLGLLLAALGAQAAGAVLSVYMGMALGLLVGFGACWFYFRWIVGPRIAGFRLVLVRDGERDATRFLETQTARF